MHESQDYGLRSMGIYRRLARNFGWSAAGQIFGRGAVFFSNIYLARILAIEQFGFFALSQTIATYFWLSVDLGTSMYGIREVAKDTKNAGELINSLLSLRFFTGLSVFILYSIGVLLLMRGDGLKTMTLLGCGFYLLSFSINAEWACKGLEKFNYVAAANLISSYIYLAGIVLLVHSDNRIHVAAFIWAMSFFGGAVFLLTLLSRRHGIAFRPVFRPKEWFMHLKESIYFTIGGLLGRFLMSIPVLLLGILATDKELGIFSAQSRIATAVVSISGLMPISFYPTFSNYYHGDIVQFKKIQRLLLSIMLVAGTGTMVVCLTLAPTLIVLLLGEKYLEGVPVFRVLAGVIFMGFMRPCFHIPILAMGLQKLRIWSMVAALVIFLAIGIWAIPQYGAYGAAVAILAGRTVEILISILIYAVKLRGAAPPASYEAYEVDRPL